LVDEAPFAADACVQFLKAFVEKLLHLSFRARWDFAAQEALLKVGVARRFGGFILRRCDGIRFFGFGGDFLGTGDRKLHRLQQCFDPALEGIIFLSGFAERQFGVVDQFFLQKIEAQIEMQRRRFGLGCLLVAFRHFAWREQTERECQLLFAIGFDAHVGLCDLQNVAANRFAAG